MLAVEKIITSKLLKPGANKRIATVDRHVGIVRPRFPCPITSQRNAFSSKPCCRGRLRNTPLLIWLLSMQVSAGLVPDGRHFVSRARDEASSWRSTYKGPIPTSAIANRLGGYVQAYTLYSSVRPFGVTAIVGGWDTEAELPVDGQVGNGPKSGSGGKVEGAKAGGPGLYMIEPSGLYWVRCDLSACGCEWIDMLTRIGRATTVLLLARDDRPPRLNSRN
mgnify:FL=1